jgi:hypothetical protein
MFDDSLGGLYKYQLLMEKLGQEKEMDTGFY